MIHAYLYALDPTPAQAEAFRSHCGAQRYAYNWGLALVKANLDQRWAERTFHCESCGLRLDRDLNAARNLAALVSEASCARTVNEPAGNPRKTSLAGNGYRHGKAPPWGANAAPRGDGSL